MWTWEDHKMHHGHQFRNGKCHRKEAVQADLDCDVCLGTIEPVLQCIPMLWFARAVTVTKKDWTPMHYWLAIPECGHILGLIMSPLHSIRLSLCPPPPNAKKMDLDAWNGYHSLPLDPMWLTGGEVTTIDREDNWLKRQIRESIPICQHGANVMSSDERSTRWQLSSDEDGQRVIETLN